MTVRDLMFALGELELSGKGDAEVDIYCDGYAASAVGVFIGRFGSVLIGDGEAKEDYNIELVVSRNVSDITIKRRRKTDEPQRLLVPPTPNPNPNYKPPIGS